MERNRRARNDAKSRPAKSTGRLLCFQEVQQARQTMRGAPHSLPGMRGTDSTTGKAVSGIDHLRQSIRDILTTPIGSRVMRRDYGSRLFQLVDSPTNQETIANVYAATVDALVKWEPRILVLQINVASILQGAMSLNLTAKYIPDGKVITLDGITIQ